MRLKNYFQFLSKEQFRRKLKDFTSFVEKTRVCRGEKRNEYVSKFGPNAWISLSSEERMKHQTKCKECKPCDLMPEAVTGRKLKKTPSVTVEQNALLETPPFLTSSRPEDGKGPLPQTPIVKKTGRRTIQKFSKYIDKFSSDWSKKYDLPLAEVFRRVKVLNLTPRKTKYQKEKMYRDSLRKVIIFMFNIYYTNNFHIIYKLI